MVELNNIEKMCMLSNFYLEYIKKNTGTIPKKPPILLTKEQHENLLKYYSKQGKKL